MIDWWRRHLFMPDKKPFDPDMSPHLGAPGGPCDAVDDPFIRTIWLMFGSRLAKTYFGLGFLIFMEATCPGPGMLATVDQKLAKEQVTTKLYPMLERSPLGNALRPERGRKNDRVDLPDARIFVAWARSASTLADKQVKWGHANEFDKWLHTSTSQEADPGELFGERFKDSPSYKRVMEGTPARKGNSRLDAGLAGSDNRRYHVPCPKCKKYQRLQLGDGTAGGLRWDHRQDGRSDPNLAYATARYVCAHCEAELGDEHRGWMMRHGVWVPEGCGVNDRLAFEAAERNNEATPLQGVPPKAPPKACAEGWHAQNGRDRNALDYLTGTPLRRGADAGFQLSSLYALTLGWGDYARQFVRAAHKPQLMRNFRNSWEGLPWEPGKPRDPGDDLGARLAGKIKWGELPEETLFITVGIDKQYREGGYFPFVALAWGEQERAWLFQYGELETAQELLGQVINFWHRTPDGRHLQPALCFLDSGWDTKDVYDFCRGRPTLIPCKGATLDAEPYSVIHLGVGKSKAKRAAARSAIGQPLVHINVDYWETEVQHRLDDRKPGDAGSLTLCVEAAADGDLLDQLLNATMDDAEDSRGGAKLLWVKRNKDDPNDYRDALRMALCAGKVYLDGRGGRLPAKSEGGGRPEARVKAVVNAGHGRPDGRPWVP